MAVFLRQGHTHEFQANTEVREDHVHRIAAVSSRPFLRSNGEHFHVVRTLTTFVDGHAHHVWTRTSNDIEIGFGQHIHRVSTRTSLNDGHRHIVRAFSFAAPNIPPLVVRRVQNG